MTGPKADVAVGPVQFQPISIRQTAVNASADNTLGDNTLYHVTRNKTIETTFTYSQTCVEFSTYTS